jgi:Tol biopolymer transport system component
MQVALFAAALATSWIVAPAHSAAGAPRILYSSDWSGIGQIYAADPAGKQPTAQITFGRAPACGKADWCGYSDPTPSPDGRYVLLDDWAACQEGQRPPTNGTSCTQATSHPVTMRTRLPFR